jgi:hypothetical protein
MKKTGGTTARQKCGSVKAGLIPRTFSAAELRGAPSDQGGVIIGQRSLKLSVVATTNQPP